MATNNLHIPDDLLNAATAGSPQPRWSTLLAVESPITHTVGTWAVADMPARAVAASATALNAII